MSSSPLTSVAGELSHPAAPSTAGATSAAGEPWVGPDFSGTWLVDRAVSDPLDAMLKLMGIPWIARKAADALTITTVIEHKPHERSVCTSDYAFGKLTATNAMISDGQPAVKTGSDGKQVTVTCDVFPPAPGDAADVLGCLRITSVLPDGLGVTVETRLLAEGGRVQRSTMVFTRHGGADHGKACTIKRVYVNKDWTEAIRQTHPVPAAKLAPVPVTLVPPAPSPVATPAPIQTPAAAAPPVTPPPSTVADTARSTPTPPLSSAAVSREPSAAPLSASPVPPDAPQPAAAAEGAAEAEVGEAKSPKKATARWAKAISAASSGAAATASASASAASGSSASSGSTGSSSGMSVSSFKTLVANAVNAEAATRAVEADPFFVSLTGTWVVDSKRSQSLDDLWKSIGVARLARLLVSSVDIVTTITHSPTLFLQEDRSALGKTVQRIPLNAEWCPVRQVDRRMMLVRAAQGQGGGDKGTNWLGYEAGFLPAILDPSKAAGREAASGRRISTDGMSGVPGGDNPHVPFFSCADFDATQYTKASIAVETLLSELTSSSSAAPIVEGVAWKGAVPSATRLVVTYELLSHSRIVQHFTHLTEKGGVMCTARRELVRRETGEETAAAAAAEKKRLSHARAVLLSRRADADAARKSLLLKMQQQLEGLDKATATTSSPVVVSPVSSVGALATSAASPLAVASGGGGAAMGAAAATSALAPVATTAQGKLAAGAATPMSATAADVDGYDYSYDYAEDGDDDLGGLACNIIVTHFTMRVSLLVAAAVVAAAQPQCTIVTPPVGCYDDSKGPHPLVVSVVASASMTQELCMQICTGAQYPLFGMTGHTSPSPLAYCYCGSDIAGGAVLAPSGDCNMPCPGGGSGNCGGNYRMVVYNTTCNPPLPPPGPSLNGTACSQPESVGWAFCNQSLPLNARVQDLVDRLTLAEMGGQLTARNTPAISRLGIPQFYWGVNNIHGVTNAVSGGTLCLPDRCVTIFPEGPALGASFNGSAFRAMGAITGKEMRALNNFNWGPIANPLSGMDGLTSWGPTINTIRDPRWGRIQETPSNDPYLLSVYAMQVTMGQQYGEDPRYLMVGTTLKHFASYSLEDTYNSSGAHVTRENFNAVVSAFDAADSYFPHFKAGVTPVSQGGAGAAGVMMAMNEFNGIPCTASSYLTGLLFNEWGLDGYVTSDGINMIQSMITPGSGHGWCPYHEGLCNLDEGVEAAAAARCDIADGSEYATNVFSSVVNNNATIASIKQLLFDSLKVRFRLGLFDNQTAATSPYWAYGEADVQDATAVAANSLAAHQALVLLQRGPLPFPRASGTTAVIGYAVNNTGRLVGNYVNQYCPSSKPDCFPTILTSIQALGEKVVYSEGCSDASTCSSSQIAAAVAAVQASSRVVLQLGLDQNLEREQHDRMNITLPTQQQALFSAVLAACTAANRPLAVVLIHGGAIAIPEIKAVSSVGILDAFYPGTQGGPAVADALFGLYSPGGKLPYDVYDVSYQEVSFFDMSIAALGRTYRYYNGPGTPGGAPLWPFGFGLSYVNFTLAWQGGAPNALAVTNTPANYTFNMVLTNTGAMAADEVVQLYIVPSASSLNPQPPYVPTRFLQGFQRVTVPAGGTAPVSITIANTAFTLTADAQGTRSLVSGTYTVAFSRGVAGDELTVPATVSV